MDKNSKKRLAEDLMVDLLYEIAEKLREKIRAGEATHQDIANAIRLLNSNGITVAINEGNPLELLKEDLPFVTDELELTMN